MECAFKADAKCPKHILCAPGHEVQVGTFQFTNITVMHPSSLDTNMDTESFCMEQQHRQSLSKQH